MRSDIIKLCLCSLWISAALASSGGCSASNTSGPYSTSQISPELDRVETNIPIYVPKPNSAYADLAPAFYYYNDGSEQDVTTFFMRDSQGEQVRVAKMRTAVTPGALDGAVGHHPDMMVEWADGRSAQVCDFTPETIRRDSMPGDPYQTCLVWWAADYSFLFYSTMPLDQTLILVNSLERFR